MLLANTEHMLDISRLNDMAPLKGSALKTVIHFRDIMAKFHADSILDFNLFHFLSSVNPIKGFGTDYTGINITVILPPQIISRPFAAVLFNVYSFRSKP